MRSTIAIPVVLAAAASVVPALAAPVATTADGSAAITWKEVGDDALDVAGAAVKIAPLFFRRELDTELFARDVAAQTSMVAPAASANSEAINWGKVATTVLGFLKREDPILARPSENELIAQNVPANSEAINWGKVATTVLGFLKREDPILARSFEDELMARDVPANSEAINWGKVASTVLGFLKREDPILARSFEDELMARDVPANSEAINWGSVAKTVLSFLKREDGLMARDVPANSEAINWGKVATTVLGFLKREDPILARSFEDELMARDVPANSEAINWGKVATTVLGFLKRDLDGELLAREDSEAVAWHPRIGVVLPNGRWPVARDVSEASEAVNWKKVGHVAGEVASDVGSVLKFLKREDPMLARAFEDELMARATAEDSEAINWGSVAKTVLSFLKREDPLLARSFEDELMARGESEAINFRPVSKIPVNLPYRIKFAREVPEESEAVNWKKVGHVAGEVASDVGSVLKFLKREDPMLARAFEDELMARATAEGSEAINWGNVAKTVLGFLKRDLDEELLARSDSEALAWRPRIGVVVPNGRFTVAREVPEDSEAINWKKVGNVAGEVASDVGSVLKFLKRGELDELD